MFQQIVIIGNLAADPELSQTENGHDLCRLRVAVDRRYRDRDGNQQTDFFNVTAWGAVAVNCGRYLKKGRKIAVGGHVENRSYQGADGQMRYTTEITADEVEFLGSAQG